MCTSLGQSASIAFHTHYCQMVYVIAGQVGMQALPPVANNVLRVRSVNVIISYYPPPPPKVPVTDNLLNVVKGLVRDVVWGIDGP